VHVPRIAALAAAFIGLAACSGGGSSSSGERPQVSPLVVTSLLDEAAPAAGTVTLRSALAAAPSGQAITFDLRLDGATLSLTQVAEEHTRLKGEVMGIREEPSGPVSYLVGYLERDYGRSALYARKDVVIDASALPRGITIAWSGGDSPGARVLAVDGDLTLVNVSISGGRSVAEPLPVGAPTDQPWTLARGGALAVWGVARLRDCRFHDNHVQGDFEASRDRGAFGGAVYANLLEMQRCVVAGNTALGAGAAGGGVFVVGGPGQRGAVSTVERSAITGNAIRGVYAYGAGLYSDGGGIGESNALRVTSSTIARNLAEPAPGLPPPVLAMGYWRGAGIYFSNGFLQVHASTVAENTARGVARTDSLGRRNLAGGIAATVGNAHAVERMTLGHSIVAGNTVEEIGGQRYAHDVYTGSLVHFRSMGYNRIGAIDFSQILVPVPWAGWESLSRRHFPKAGDAAGVALGDVVDVAAVATDPTFPSAGVAAGGPTVLYYEPRGTALGQVPAYAYTVDETIAEYSLSAEATDTFLAVLLERLERHFGLEGYAAAFQADFEAFLQSADTDAAVAGAQPYRDPDGRPITTLAATQFFGPAQTWPREFANHPYIEFWHRLDAALAQAAPAVGPEGLGDDEWRALFQSGALAENPGIRMTVETRSAFEATRAAEDQRGTARPAGEPGDVGAIELR
jgi:hypothetical protein